MGGKEWKGITGARTIMEGRVRKEAGGMGEGKTTRIRKIEGLLLQVATVDRYLLVTSFCAYYWP